LGGVGTTGEIEQRGRHVVTDDRVERGADVVGQPP
jgi:hypothetical protein